MMKKIVSLLLTLSMSISMITSLGVNAAVTDEEEIPVRIGKVQEEYVPGQTYFVSESDTEWPGEDNMNGDITQQCLAPGTSNAHGRFGGLWQSMGFAKYVFSNIFDEIPGIGYHCNPADLNGKAEIVGRYATKCRYIRGSYDSDMTAENIKNLMCDAKQGDIIVVAPEKKCNRTGQAMIVLSTNDAAVNVYTADWFGMCEVSEQTITYDALAMYHCVTLLRSTNYPYPDPVAPEAVDGIELSSNDFSLNESVDIKWQKVKNTKKYNVYLVDENDNVASETECNSSVASFVFKNAGKYRIKIIASNEYGDSDAIYSGEIVVHNQNVVTFRDYDGTVITTQKVEYGKDAVAPNVPQRKGYQFAGWDRSLENIKEPTEITATYEVEKYTIKYYDIGGKRVLLSETIEYHGTANPPANYTLDEGYVFAGWQISYDSVGTDYNCVDGDMTLIATEKWANLNLPIAITVSDSYRNADGTKYTATLNIENHDPEAGKNVKILGTLKASDGKALKIVVLYELSLKANESLTRDVEIVYSEKAATMEFVAVGMVGNSKTGGAFSEVASANILDNTRWGTWTDWTAEDQIASYDTYETKTQYRYRNKTYTTSSSGSLSGWTKYNTTSSTGSWSGWSNSSISAFTNDSQKREVESRYIAPKYKTQYRYGRWTTGYYHHFCPQLGYSYYGGYWREQFTDWSDSSVSKDTSTKWTCGYSGHTHRYPDYTDGARGYWYSYNVGGKKYYWQETRDVEDIPGYYQYRYRDTYYTHYFWKWGDWSSWNDTYKSGDETATRIMYRYRNRSDSGEPEDTSGEFFKVEGTLNNVTDDFAGKKSTIMVYKRCNTDPTEEQLEYVGQTTIGEGNTYSFEFKPREMPSSETGEFIVALGIEGADRLVNVDVIEADVPDYRVQFVVDGVNIEDPNAEYITDSDGNTSKAQIVKEGETAIAPEPPVKEGYTFVKWSETLTGIKTNKIITAEYVPNEYSVVFIDWEKNTVDTQKYKYGETIVYPPLDPVDGAQIRNWDQHLNGVDVVTGNMIIGSVAELNEYTVTFIMDDVVVSTQTIKHGQKAALPEQVPSAEGMIFAGWVGTCSYEYITQDSTFRPSFMYAKTVSMPEADMTMNNDGSTTVKLSCDTEGAQIYYIIESCTDGECMLQSCELEGEICESEFELMEETEVEQEYIDGFQAMAVPYTGEVTLASDETITFVAYADGMNSSIPVKESADNQDLYFDIDVKSSNIQEYRNSVKGEAVFEFINNSPEYSMASFTLCFYDGRGVLIDFIPQNVDVVPGTNMVEFKDICVDNIDYSKSKNIECRLITWLSGEKVKSISDFVCVDIK